MEEPRRLLNPNQYHIASTVSRPRSSGISSDSTSALDSFQEGFISHLVDHLLETIMANVVYIENGSIEGLCYVFPILLTSFARKIEHSERSQMPGLSCC